MWVLCISCIVMVMPTHEEGEVAAGKAEHAPLQGDAVGEDGKTTVQADKMLSSPSPTGGRWLMLDALRVACLVCIVIEHQPNGGDAYSAHDTFFTTQWVLPVLLLTSGIAFMQSSSPMWKYLSRLTAVFVVGFLCNMFADVIARPGWYKDIGNTVFQMFYVVAIAGLAILVYPLRAMLRTSHLPDGGDSLLICGASDRLVAAAVYLTLWGLSLLLYLSGLDLRGFVMMVMKSADRGSWASYIADIITFLPYMAAHILGVPAFISLHFILRKKPTPRLTWLIFAYIYVPPVAFPMSFAGVPHLGMLYLLGLLHQSVNLVFWPSLKKCLQSYWLLCLLPLLFLYMPDLLGRCDLYPAVTIWERFRWYAVEAALMSFVLGRILVATDPYVILGHLGWWALFAYVTHVMFARLLPSPGGAIVEFLFIPIFVYYPHALSLVQDEKGGFQWPWRKAPGVADSKPPADAYGTFAGVKA
uniref:Acyltransferase 3 domain-containing protein n=1 Tax=Haptolina brevifila TaxID=156173 RepID=A0A6U7MFS3_9EUKA